MLYVFLVVVERRNLPSTLPLFYCCDRLRMLDLYVGCDEVEG
jgi:hypothetical protein